MRLAVVGAGAMGGALAAEAARVGHEVHVVDVSRDLVDTIVERGLLVVSNGVELVERVSATDDPHTVGQVDVIVVFVKASHTQSTLPALAALRGPGTAVVSLQNGWGNSDLISEGLGSEGLVFGVTYHSCSVIGPAQVAHTGHGETFVGPYAGSDLSYAERTAELLLSAGWETTVSADVRTEIWKKLVLNTATLPTAALTGLVAGEVDQEPDMSQLIDDLARETVGIANALGMKLDIDERIARIHAICRAAGSGRASMLQDVMAKRKTEIEVINGAVVRAAEQLGMDAPINRAMVALIHGLERGWSR